MEKVRGELHKFADWFVDRAEEFKHLTVDQVVEHFKQEQKRRDDHKADDQWTNEGGAK